MVRASVGRPGFNFLVQPYQKILKTVITASVFGVSRENDNMEKKGIIFGCCILG